MAEISAELVKRGAKTIDIKLVIDGDMHLLRWRRTTFADQVLFDERIVAQSKGLFGRETVFGLAPKTKADEELRLLLTIDPEADWMDMSGEERCKGVRLETAGEPLVAVGSLGPDRIEPFRKLYDRAIEAIGLS